jgi:hypothetical protein
MQTIRACQNSFFDLLYAYILLLTPISFSTIQPSLHRLCSDEQGEHPVPSCSPLACKTSRDFLLAR